MQHNLPNPAAAGNNAPADAGDGAGAAEVERQILRFLRQMNAGDDDGALRDLAIARHWLGDDGAPTPEGRRLAQGFTDLDEARANGAF